MPDFARVIRDAYREILERDADAEGLAGYNGQMNAGMSEATMREALLRSPEFASRNPAADLPARLGLNVHIPSDPMIDDVTRGLGMRWVRLDFDWFRIEPQQGVLHWEELDRVVSRTAARGAQMLATLAYTPSWASSNPDGPRTSDPPAGTGSWTDFVRAAIERYRHEVRHWQFWNEPNVREFWTGSRAQYRTQILEPGASVARAIDPGLQVVAPGLANLGDWRDWFREAMKARDAIDIIDHHDYQRSGREVLLDLERERPGQPSLRTLIRQLGVEDKPFWLTETGVRSDQADQRRYYEDVVGVLREKTWVNRLFFFHYWDGPGQGDGGFGIVNEDFSPKPAYYFLQSVLRPTGVTRLVPGALGTTR
ncbi:MAG: hypothetical protein DMF80_13095 [Acidobacteria bacterium]|nr:MAG: hypothetical protein DMF80_13095 [Acidobacteriota bacterium]